MNRGKCLIAKAIFVGESIWKCFFYMFQDIHCISMKFLELRLKSENPNQHIRNVADGTLFTLPYSVLWF